MQQEIKKITLFIVSRASKPKEVNHLRCASTVIRGERWIVANCAYCRFHLTLPLREASPRTRAARSLKIETLIREIVWWKISWPQAGGRSTVTDLGAHVYGPGGGTCERVRFEKPWPYLFRALFVESSTGMKKTNCPLVGRLWERKWLRARTVVARWEPTNPTHGPTWQVTAGIPGQASPNCESRASIAPVAVKSFTTLSRASFLF